MEEPLIYENDHYVSKNDNQVKHPIRPCICISVLVSGIIIGLMVQIITLGSHAYIILHWGKYNERAQANMVLWYLMKCLSHFDVCLYVITWIIFFLIMTRPGITFLYRHRQQLDDCISCDTSNGSMATMRKEYFNIGVNFLMGLILGSFLSWIGLNLMIGVLSPLAPIVQCMVIDFLLCYSLIIIYGWFEKEDDNDYDVEEEQDDNDIYDIDDFYKLNVDMSNNNIAINVI